MKILKLLPAALLALACRDTTHDEHKIDVQTMRLTITTAGSTSSQTVTVASNPGCAVTGGPIALTVNQPRTVAAAFLNAAGAPDPEANNPAEFQLAGGTGQPNPTPTPASITFNRTGAFSGTLTGSAATTGSVFLSLLHPREGHADWGPCSVPITVSP